MDTWMTLVETQLSVSCSVSAGWAITKHSIFLFWATKLAFCQKNFFYSLLFVQLFLDTWRPIPYPMCRILFITCQLGLCSSSDNLWGLWRLLDGFVHRKGEQEKLLLQSRLSPGSNQSLSVPEVMSLPCLSFLVKGGYFTVYYQRQP